MANHTENTCLKYIFTSVGVASTTDGILVFLLPVILLNYYHLSLKEVTFIFSAGKFAAPFFVFIAGYLSDKVHIKNLLISAYVIAIFLPILLLLPFYFPKMFPLFYLCLILTILNSLVFSLVIAQEPFFVENSRKPQSSLTKLYYIANLCLLIGTFGLVLYFTYLNNIIPLLWFKLATDIIAFGFVSKAFRSENKAGFPIKHSQPVTSPTGAFQVAAAGGFYYLVSAVLLAMLLSIGYYFINYLIPIYINAKLEAMEMVSIPFIIITATNFIVNLMISKEKIKITANRLYVCLAILVLLSIMLVYAAETTWLFFIWTLGFAVLFSFLFAFANINMLLETPDAIKGRMRGTLQTCHNIFTGAFAYLFMDIFNNDLKQISMTVVPTVITISLFYFYWRSLRKTGGVAIEEVQGKL